MQAVRVHASRDVDELVLLDVEATKQGRTISAALVRRVSLTLRVPLTVGGGIQSAAHVAGLLDAGADKIVLGSSAVRTEGLIGELSSIFGAQAIMCAIDSVDVSHRQVAVASGSIVVDELPSELAVRLQNQGAGELLVQSVFHEGRRAGMDFELIRKVASAVTIPVVASSGASGPDDFFNAYLAGASAVCAGALFQFSEITPEYIRHELQVRGVAVRRA
jgi:cyclase